MDATTRKIVKMLGDERIERRCAAAMVLGELRARDAAVVDALSACLDEPLPLLQGYALEALAGVKSAKIAKRALPLLDHPDEAIRAAAATLLANQGARAQRTLAGELSSGPLPRRRAILSILRQHHDAATLGQLVAQLSDPELGEAVLAALRDELEQMAPAARKALEQQILELLPPGPEPRAVAGAARALRLLGQLGQAKAVTVLLKHAAPGQPLPLRLAAVGALRRPLAAARATDRAAMTLLALADDEEAPLARAAVDTLRTLKLPASAAKPLAQLAEGRHAEARRFAVEALGRSGSQSAVLKTLLAHLGGDDPAAREAAVKTLARMEAVARPLIKRLEACGDDEPQAALLCRLLRRRLEQLKPTDRKALTELGRRWLAAEASAAPSLLQLVRAVDPTAYAALLGERAQAQRKAKRYQQAFELYRRLEEGGLLDEDGRYAAALCGLCALPSSKELGRASRTTHPVLRHLVELVGGGYPVATKLRRDRTLDKEALFFLGFNFAESADEEEKAFGGDLLQHLAQSSPRSKLGRSAKNKLKLVGLG